MTPKMLETVVETIGFVNTRVINGWNAKDNGERNFELAQASKILEELSLSIRCELSKEEEIQAKIRLAKKELNR